LPAEALKRTPEGHRRSRKKEHKKGLSMKKRTPMQKLLRLTREESGTELVEFALTSLMLIGLLFAVFNWMLGMYVYHFTTYAAQQATRFAIVRGNTWSKNTATNCSTSAPPNFTMPYNCTASSADIQNYVQSLASPGIVASGLTINETSSYVWPGKTPDNTTSPCSTHANSQGCLVKVTVNYNFAFMPIMKLSALPMAATSEKVIVE
jgi:Flp pilus assembly protein TadG